jgi:hypothetical protein
MHNSVTQYLEIWKYGLKEWQSEHTEAGQSSSFATPFLALLI